MVRSNEKAEAIFEIVRREIQQNGFGNPGEKFIDVRTLAARFSVRTSTAHAVFAALRAESLIMLIKKQHYLSHGRIPVHAPLRKCRTERKIISLLCTHTLSYYIPVFADKAATALRKSGYELIIQYVTPENYCDAVRTAYEMGVQAFFVIAGTLLSTKICKMSLLPCITSEIDLTDIGTDSVMSGGGQQTSRLVDMMEEAGCRTLFFALPEIETKDQNTIYKNFCTKLLNSNLKFSEENIFTQSDLINTKNRCAAKIAAVEGRVGIICANDSVCNLVVAFLQENAISIYDKVMLGSFRIKSEISREHAGVITVEENIELEAEEAVKLILKRVEGDTSPARRITVEPIVINRTINQ